MNPLLSLDFPSTDSDVFYVECSSAEGSPIRKKDPGSPQFYGAIKSYGKRDNHNLLRRLSGTTNKTIDSDSNEPTIPFGFGSQHLIVPPSLNDLNLPPNQLNVLATMAVIRADEAYSPQSPEPSIPSPILTPQWMWVPLKAGRQRTQQRTMPHSILRMSPDESMGIFLQATLLTPMSQEMYWPLQALPAHRRLHEEKKGSWAWGFSQKTGVWQHSCEACRQTLPAKKTPWCSGETQTIYTFS